jgi:serine/threonine-protein kinase
MPLLDGETAQQRLARHPDGMPALQALAIVETVLDVLAAAHACGIVHRDLKPDNIFLERSGAVRVLDFGIAHVSSNMELTQMGTVVGTAGYLPPEQARGQVREAGPRSDLWSVGAMLYTLLTGRVLHDSPNLIQSIIRAQNEAVPPARELIPGVLDSVAHVLDGALAFDARNRWTDAVAMRLAVRAAIDDVRLAQSRPANHSNAGVTIESLARTAPSDAPVAMDGVESLDAFRATRRPLAWLAAVCVAAAWIVVAAFIAHGRPAPVVVASAASQPPPPALDVPMVTGSTSDLPMSLPSLAPEVTPDELPAAPVATVTASASARAPVAQAPKGPHKAREIVRQLNF